MYRRVNGRKLTKLLAEIPEVQANLAMQTQRGATRAARLLDERSRHRTHTSQVTTARGKVDHYVILDDTRGLRAAMTIEYGRKPSVSEDGSIDPGMEGLHVLRDAFPRARRL